MYGKALRLARIFNQEDNRTCIVPLDHGTTLGPVEGIQDYIKAISEIAKGGGDAVVVHKGIMSRISSHPQLANMKYMVHLSVSTVLGQDPNEKVLVASVEEAVKLGADGISIHVNMGTATEAAMIRDFGIVSRACLEWGMPLFAMMYARNDGATPYDIAHSARLADELGADIVKVNYPGSIEAMRKVIEGVQIPVVIAGGPKSDKPEVLLEMIDNAMKAGARGVSIGRNIFQHPCQAAFTNLIKGLVHNEYDLEYCINRLQNIGGEM